MRALRPISALLILSFFSACSTIPPAGRPMRLPEEAHRALLAGDSVPAYEYFIDAARRSPRYSASRSAAAASARQAGMLSEALEQRLMALRVEPDSEWDRIWAARLLLAQADPEEALIRLGESEAAFGLLTKAQALRMSDLFDDALSALDAAAMADPSQPLAWQERAEILEHLGRFAESASAYAVAISIDPSQTHLQLRLARIERRLGLEADAYERLRKFLLVDAGHPAAKAEKSQLAESAPQLARQEEENEASRALAWAATRAPLLHPLPPTPLSPLRVGIVTGISEFRVRFARPCRISHADGREFRIPEQVEIRGKADPASLELSWSGSEVSSNRPLVISAEDPQSTFMVFDVHFAKGYYWSDRETRSFRGDLSVVLEAGRISLVNLVGLEEYLPGVIPSEMPFHWPLEALKAQAVAARTETLRKIGRHEKSGFDVCATQHCAVYRGAGGEREKSTEAVRSTRGQVLKAGGRPVDTVYAGNCGGWGSSPQAVWNGSIDRRGICDIPPSALKKWRSVPYDPDLRERFILQRVPAYCGHKADSPSFRWTRCYSEEELSGWLNRKFGVERLESIRIGTRTHEGWITSILVRGANSTQEIRKDAIRSALGMIRSNYFTLEYLPAAGSAPGRYIFYGAGWGHGAGMCQDGVYGLAKLGRSYAEIVSHYYRDARLVKLY